MKILLKRLRDLLAQGQPGTVAADGDPTEPGAGPDHDGTLSVADGQVWVTEPAGSGRWPVLKPGLGVRVVVDGETVTGPVVVSADRHIDLEVPAAPRMRSAMVTVTPDRMTAYLHLGPGTAERWEIQDQEPRATLAPRAVRHEVTLPAPTLEEIEALLAVQGVKHGINWDDVRQALTVALPHTAVVAQGTPPVPAHQGHIELRLPRAEQNRPLSVETGTVLAIRTAPSPGRPGRDVCGRILYPESEPGEELAPGTGTAFSPNGRQLIATVTGIPTIVRSDGTMRISISPQLVHRGNLERREEPLTYDGDILIEGWVEPGAVVHATGHVHVLAGVQGAELESGAELHILGGCIRSQIRQGADRAMALTLQKHLRELAAELNRLHQATVQAVNHPRYARVAGANHLGPLITLLVQHRFGRLPELVRLLRTATADHLHEQAVQARNLVSTVENAVLNGEVRTPEELESLARVATGLRFGLPGARAGPAGRVVLYHLLHSRVDAAGSVEVTGPGAEHSEIHAGGTVTISGHLRGGRVQAGASVRLGRVGAPAEIPTLVSVPADATIQAEHCFPGTVCEIGPRSHRILDEVAGITLRLDQAGRIAVHYL